MALTEFEQTVNGTTVHGLSAGEGPLVLCLHGFPDHPATFTSQLEALAAAGYRGVAPYMPLSLIHI